MSSAEQPNEEEHHNVEVASNHVCPSPKSIGELVASDQVPDQRRKCMPRRKNRVPGNSKNVLVKKLVFLWEDQTEKTVYLSGDLPNYQTVFTMSEGVPFCIRIEFLVQHETVKGLQYIHKNYKFGRFGLQRVNTKVVVGSVAPNMDIQSYTTPMLDNTTTLHPGKYTVASLFTDDDHNEYLNWEWFYEI